MRRLPLLSILILASVYWYATSAQAAISALAYDGLQPCYTVGSALPTFTLTAHVASAGIYRITHAVTIAGSPPATPTTIYSGTLDPTTPKVVSFHGGTVVVPGTYRLTGALYSVGNGTAIAQTTTSIRATEACPTPTEEPTPTPSSMPQPSPKPGPDAIQAPPPDVRWSQALSQERSKPDQSILAIAIRGKNVGKGSGGSDAILHYDPTVLRLLDAAPTRIIDWVRTRDDTAGTLTLALGELARSEDAAIYVRFLVVYQAPTVIRLVRDDGLDRANPLFLTADTPDNTPIALATELTSTTIKISGRGFKPGESLALWANMPQDHVLAIEDGFTATSDADGSVSLLIPLPAGDVLSIVVYGRLSNAVGVAHIASATARTQR